MATSCNDDDDDGGNSTPTPVNYTFKADVAFPFEQDTPNAVWSSTNVTATQRLDGSFQMIALSDGDSLVITTLGKEVNLEYELDSASAAFLLSSLADENYYVRADGRKYGIVTSESSSSIFYTSDDTANKTISGIFNLGLEELIPTGPGGANEIVTFLNGEITDLPYTIEDFDIGPPVGGSGFISFTAGSESLNFDPASGTFITPDALTLAGSGSDVTGVPSVLIGINESSLTPGTYELDETQAISFIYTPEVGDSFLGLSGTLTVASHDEVTNNITGSFEINAETFSLMGPGEPIQISNGLFDVTYVD